MKSLLRLLAVLGALGGVAAIAVGALRYSSEQGFRAGAGRALGKVVEFQTTPVDGETSRSCPIVEFSPAGAAPRPGTPAAPPQSFVDRDCAADRRKGDIVPVLYDPLAPAQARIDSGESPLSASLGVVGWALLSWALAAAALLLARLLPVASPDANSR